MLKYIISIALTLLFCSAEMQGQSIIRDSTKTQQDSLKRRDLIRQLGNGFFPTKYFDIDLRYLIKFNQYEGFRTGLGGVTNDAFSEKYRVNGYTVYGFRDHRFKYSIGGGIRLVPKSNTWLNFSYVDDLQEAGSSKFITDKRFFQFFEPRLLNIDLFYKYISKHISLEHQISPRLVTETQLGVSNINPTYNYIYNVNGKSYSEINLSTAVISLQWSPFSIYELVEKRIKEVKIGFPKFTLQYTQSVKGVFESDLNFAKIDFRTIYEINYKKNNFSRFVLVAGIARGNAPLSHLYHAYPNNINKQTVLQRFSVAGIDSFETMYFNEFFSDRFVTLQFRHYFSPFNISTRFKPQLVVISRFALGNMSNIERHEGITFGTLDKGFTESGFELNKLLFGFGLSATYRYGAYHLPQTADNIAVKFTFNVTL